MTLDLLINFEVNPNFISCGRISYEVGTLLNGIKGRGKCCQLIWLDVYEEDPVSVLLWLLVYYVMKILLRNRSR